MDRNTIISKLKIGSSFVFDEEFSRELFNERIHLIDSSHPNARFITTDYKIVSGAYKRYIRFDFPDGNVDYMLFSASSADALPWEVAVGTLVTDKVHLIKETCSLTNHTLTLISIPDASFFEGHVGKSAPEKQIWTFQSFYDYDAKPRNPNIHSFLGFRQIERQDVKHINDALGAKKRIKDYFGSLK